MLSTRLAAPGDRAGDPIGRCELLEELGEGGMGSVWMAQQAEPALEGAWFSS